jgi:phenylacetic acid degradation operon negative regulatory protein
MPDIVSGPMLPGVTSTTEVELSKVRPQSVLLSFLGLYLRGREVAVSTGSLIEVLRRVGVGEEAVRSTVNRMVKKELLARHKSGRQVYIGLTPRSQDVLEEGHRRIWEQGATNRSWDGTWTIVAFTLPDERRSERHELRTRLQWAGFGPLQGGLWVAAGRRDVEDAVAALDVREHLVALAGEAVAPSAPGEVIRRAFDTAALARAYRQFLENWAGTRDVVTELPDDLARQLLLHTDWLGAVRRDPHLPVEHLPEGWPAVEAQKVFRRLAAAWERPAAAEAGGVLDLMEL